MFGEFNEAAQPKNSLTRQIFNRIQLFSCTNASAPNSVFEAVRQTLHINVCEKVCGQTTPRTDIQVDHGHTKNLECVILIKKIVY